MDVKEIFLDKWINNKNDNYDNYIDNFQKETIRKKKEEKARKKEEKRLAKLEAAKNNNTEIVIEEEEEKEEKVCECPPPPVCPVVVPKPPPLLLPKKKKEENDKESKESKKSSKNSKNNKNKDKDKDKEYDEIEESSEESEDEEKDRTSAGFLKSLKNVFSKHAKKKIAESEELKDNELASDLVDIGVKLGETIADGIIDEVEGSSDESEDEEEYIETKNTSSTSKSEVIVPKGMNVTITSPPVATTPEITINILNYDKLCKKITKKFLQLGERITDENNEVLNILSKNIKNISFLGEPVRPFEHTGTAILIEDNKMFLVELVKGVIEYREKEKSLDTLIKENRYDTLLAELNNNGGIIPMIFDNEDTLHEYSDKTAFINKSLTFAGSK